MNKTLGLLFHLKLTKTKANGLAPIYLRITIDGVRADLSSKRFIDPCKWNSAAQKGNGSSEEIRNLNAYLKTLEQNAYEMLRILIEKKLPITAATLKDYMLYRKREISERMLLQIFKEHNRQVETLIGKGFAKGTYERYEISLRHTTAFIKWKYDLNDIPVSKVDHDFITSFDFYPRSVRNCANNSTVKYLKNFKKIILISIASGWIDKDPFLKYKVKLKEVVREYLDMEEIQRIANKEFKFDRLSQVRDIFLFYCFTGLAYADVKKLRRSEILRDNKGEEWINTYRQKTKTVVRVPILDSALNIINKYSNNPESSAYAKILDIKVSQDMAMLKKKLVSF